MLLVLAGCSKKDSTEDLVNVAADGSFTIAHVDGEYTVVELGADLGEDVVYIDDFFDPLCPACITFSEDTGARMGYLLRSQNVAVTYHPVMFLNDRSVGDYSARTAAFVVATAEHAPKLAFDFIKAVLTYDFIGSSGDMMRPQVEKVEDSEYLDLLKELGATEDQLEVIDTNKDKYIAHVVLGTEYFTEDKDLAALSPEADANGNQYVFTPYIIVNHGGNLSMVGNGSSMAMLLSYNTLSNDLEAAVSEARESAQVDATTEADIEADTEADN